MQKSSKKLGKKVYKKVARNKARKYVRKAIARNYTIQQAERCQGTRKERRQKK